MDRREERRLVACLFIDVLHAIGYVGWSELLSSRV